MRDCDVVIVNYNAGKLLIECVCSVFLAGAEKCIVVDNASRDGSIDDLEQATSNKNLLVIRNDVNLGFATACNLGIRESSASRVLFLNPDCTLADDALVRMVDVLCCSGTIGMVGGFLCNPDGSEQGGGRRAVPTPWRSFVRAMGLNRLAKRWPTLFFDFYLHKLPLPDRAIEVEAISGACMLVKREAVDDVGLWDEGYFLHCEDLDWCMRFRQHGWKILFVPDAKVVHQKGACSRSRPIFVEWHKHKGMMRFYRKFFRGQYPDVLMWLLAVGVWLRFGAVIAYYTVRRAFSSWR